MDILTNRLGDRLTGSDSYYSACVWAVNTIRSWGMVLTADFTEKKFRDRKDLSSLREKS